MDAFEQMPKIHWPPQHISPEFFAHQMVKATTSLHPLPIAIPICVID